MRSRQTTLIVAVVFSLGMALFIGIRWSGVSAEAGVEGSAVAWFALPLGLTYAGASAIGLLLAGDGTKRRWWLPGTAFVALGLPVESWVTGSSFLASQVGSFAGTAVDLAAVLTPAAVYLMLAKTPRTASRNRLVPSVAMISVSLVAAMLVGQYGPDVSLSVGIALLSFGVLSQSASWRRAAAFIAVALCLGAQVAASFATGISQGYPGFGFVAFKDASLEVVVALLAYSIAPLSAAWDHLLTQRSTAVVEAPAPS